MKRYLFTIGTGLLIAVAPLMWILTWAHADSRYAKIALIALAVVGFAMQMFSAFTEKFAFEREMRRKREEHARIMEKASTLPPEQAIDLLLKNL